LSDLFESRTFTVLETSSLLRTYRYLNLVEDSLNLDPSCLFALILSIFPLDTTDANKRMEYPKKKRVSI